MTSSDESYQDSFRFSIQFLFQEQFETEIWVFDYWRLHLQKKVLEIPSKDALARSET